MVTNSRFYHLLKPKYIRNENIPNTTKHLVDDYGEKLEDLYVDDFYLVDQIICFNPVRQQSLLLSLSFILRVIKNMATKMTTLRLLIQNLLSIK